MAKLDVEDLEVWQLAMDAVTRHYEVTRTWPKEELYGLTSQVRRAAVSIPTNIAEGKYRETTPDFLRFVSISSGSNGEVRILLRIAKKISATSKRRLSRNWTRNIIASHKWPGRYVVRCATDSKKAVSFSRST
ncbi:MAG: four helix bundle protein [Planctomycetes bacterium]|nr:four helix bundle protein [Planctomycetota bacterium]